MNYLKKPGTYLAVPIEWAVNARPGKCACWIVRFRVKAERTPAGAWIPVEGDPQITAFMYLQKNERDQAGNPTGNFLPNETTLVAIAEAFGWTGQIPDLERNDWSSVEVQLFCDISTHNGKERLDVRRVRHRDYSGGLQKSDPARLQTLDAAFGSQARAIIASSSSHAGAPAKTPHSPATATRPTPPPADPVQAAKRAAWDALVKKYTEHQAETGAVASRDTMTEGFRRAIASAKPGHDPTKFSAADWQEIENTIRKDFSVAINDVVPF